MDDQNMNLEDQPWFEDGVIMLAGKAILDEIKHLSVTAIGKLGAFGAQKALKKTVSAYLLKRFNKYTQIYPEISPIREFDASKYDLREAEEKYGITFSLAKKWAEKLDNRVEVRVYSKNGKGAFAIAYGKISRSAMYNTEFTWLDNRYKKHDDFYTASAHAHVGIGHPSIERLIKKMRNDWEKLSKTRDNMVLESVQEAFISGSFEQKKQNILDAVSAGEVDETSASIYLEELELSGFDTEPDFFDQWI